MKNEKKTQAKPITNLFFEMFCCYLFLLLLVKVDSSDILTTFTKNEKYYEIAYKVFVTSAFHKTKGNYILLQGNTKQKIPKLKNCKVVENDKNYTCDSSYSKYWKMDEDFFDIKITYNTKLNPKYLYLNNVLIKVSPELHGYYKYVVCSPVMYNYTSANFLIQRMESLKHFGVSKVVTYFIDASVEVQRILRYYIKTRFLVLYRFDKYVEYNVWGDSYYGEVWKLNHCFHRYQENAQYIFDSDLDEIIWPTTANNYDELFSLLPKSDIFYFVNKVHIIPEYYRDMKDYDFFNISDTCTGKKRWNRKYVIASPLRYSNIEVHTAVYHDWFLKETTVDLKYACSRHSKFDSKWLKDCKNHKPYKDDSNAEKIKNRVNKVKDRIFQRNVYLL